MTKRPGDKVPQRYACQIKLLPIRARGKGRHLALHHKLQPGVQLAGSEPCRLGVI